MKFTEVNGMTMRKVSRDKGSIALSLLIALISAAIAVVTLVIGVRCYSAGCGKGAPSDAGGTAVGEATEAPDLMLKDLSGKDVKLSEYKDIRRDRRARHRRRNRW